MIKLVRNTFGSQKYLTDNDNNIIDWTFLEKLVDKQNFEGLHLGTKIRNRRLQWTREKMSVADALMYLSQDLNMPSFKNAQATANFVLNFNNIFDIFNSRNRLSKYIFKRPLSQSNSDFFLNYMEQMVQYIISLKLVDVPVTKSARKTGFLGFLVCINSLKNFYSKYVDTKRLKYILTNKFSQDHLEQFFGAIRAKGGFNNNPSVRHFEAAYKRLLIHTEVTGPDSGNVSINDQLSILTCGSGHQVTVDDNGNDLRNAKHYLDFEEQLKNDIANYKFYSSEVWNLTEYVEDVVGYIICGYVVKSLKKCITCNKCINILGGDSVRRLQRRKTYGALTDPSDVVVKICMAAEKYFRFFQKTRDIFDKNVKNLPIILIKNTLETVSSNILDKFEHHMLEDDPINGHSVNLIKLISEKYFKIRIHYETMKKLDQAKKVRIRSVYTKTL
nr:unnamed protein product [Callosobruchus chinensis]